MLYVITNFPATCLIFLKRMLHAFYARSRVLYECHVISFIGLSPNVFTSRGVRKVKHNLRTKLIEMNDRRVNDVKRDQLFRLYVSFVRIMVSFFIFIFFSFFSLFLCVHKNDTWQRFVALIFS